MEAKFRVDGIQPQSTATFSYFLNTTMPPFHDIEVLGLFPTPGKLEYHYS